MPVERATCWQNRQTGQLNPPCWLCGAAQSILAPFLAGAKGEIALYDVAIHNNLGDPVMWSAAARLIGEFHRLAKVVCAVTQFHGWESMRHFPMCNLEQTIQTVGNGGVIFLHSGGNWGTVWYAVHEARMKYLGKMAQYVKNGTANFRVGRWLHDEQLGLPVVSGTTACVSCMYI